MPDATPWPTALDPASDAAGYARILGAAGGRVVRQKSAPGHDVHLALYESPAYDLRVAAIDVARLSINLRTVPVTGRIGDEPVRRYNGRRHSFYLTPAGFAAAWRKESPSRHVNIYFDALALDEATDGAHPAVRPLVNASRPALRPWFDALELAMLHDAPYVDDAAIGLARAILSSVVRSAVALPAEMLPRQIVVRLHDFVASHLGGSIRVADLAAVAGMPQGRFVLAFKATTGTPPHRFVIAQRLRCATRLLAGSRLDLAEVAIASGFASQQHMTTLMRRSLGKTPAQLRREARG